MKQPDYVHSSVPNAVRGMLDQGFEQYSMSRVNLDGGIGAFSVYINAINELLLKEGAEFAHVMSNDQTNEFHSRVYIIGGRTEKEIKVTDHLVELVDACPNGPVLDKIRENIASGDDSIKIYLDKGIDNVIEGLAEGERIVKMNSLPLYFTKENMKDLYKTFFPFHDITF